MGTRKTIPAPAIEAALTRIADAIVERHRATAKLVLLGIANGGIVVNNRLAAAVSERRGAPVPAGVLDISFHRDDVGLHPIPKETPGTILPADIGDSVIVLVDDVLFSGRTIRAALDELFSHGRPSTVELAVLVDRGNRRLPFAADYVGFAENTAPNEKVKVNLDAAAPARDEIIIYDPS